MRDISILSLHCPFSSLSEENLEYRVSLISSFRCKALYLFFSTHCKLFKSSCFNWHFFGALLFLPFLFFYFCQTQKLKISKQYRSRLIFSFQLISLIFCLIPISPPPVCQPCSGPDAGWNVRGEFFNFCAESMPRWRLRCTLECLQGSGRGGGRRSLKCSCNGCSGNDEQTERWTVHPREKAFISLLIRPPIGRGIYEKIKASGGGVFGKKFKQNFRPKLGKMRVILADLASYMCFRRHPFYTGN